MPLLHVRDAFRDARFVLAILLGNFILIPLLVWLALHALPDDPALHLGVLLVLLVPCTDWFITFTQLGQGNTARAIAVTPLNLLLQLLLLPAYLWLMLPAADFSTAIKTEEMLPAALMLIGVPLVAAALTERWVEAIPERAVWRERLGWWPVPLLAVVVFLIAGAQVGTVHDAGPVLLSVLPVFVGFLLVAALVLSAAGDAFWSREGERALLGGLAAFFAAHIAYVVLFLRMGDGAAGFLAEPWRSGLTQTWPSDHKDSARNSCTLGCVLGTLSRMGNSCGSNTRVSAPNWRKMRSASRANLRLNDCGRSDP